MTDSDHNLYLRLCALTRDCISELDALCAPSESTSPGRDSSEDEHSDDYVSDACSVT